MASNERGQIVLRQLDFSIGKPLCYVLGCFRVSHELPSSPHRIGVMIFGAIGDALLASSVLDSMKNAYPDASLVLLLSQANKGVSKLLRGYDEICVLDVTRPQRAIPKLRAENIDLLVDTSQWPRVSAVLSFFSRAKCCVGFKTPGQGRHYVYDIVAEHSNQRHELDNFRALAVVAGGAKEGYPVINPPQPFDPKQYGINLPYIIIHPWAAGYKSELREWPMDRWRELIGKLTDIDINVVITGGPNDVSATNHMLDGLPAADHVVSLAGIISLDELRDCLAGSIGAISVNTGVMHLASLLGINVISLNGPTNAQRWGGVGVNVLNLDVTTEMGGAYLNLGFEYPKNATNIMGMLSVDQVFSSCMSHILPPDRV